VVIGGSDYYDKTPAAAARYDALHATQIEDTAFYVGEAQNHGAPVLEIGCGTGRVTLAIAEAGVRVVGIDSSAHMLEVAASMTSGSGSLWCVVICGSSRFGGRSRRS
jgi:ubiquinone/menaquinone biosynthesis C-methylase UbiE